MKYAIIVIFVAAFGLSACEKQTQPSTNEEKVASWDNGYVTKAELDYALKQLGPLDRDNANQVRTKALDELISQKLIYAASEKDGLTKSPDVKLAEELAMRQAVVRAYVQNLSAQLGMPTDSDIKNYYNEHPLLFSERKVYQLQEIHVVAKPEQADAIKSQLEKSKTLQELAAWLKSQSMPVEVQVVVKPAEQLPDLLRTKLATQAPGNVTLLPAEDGVTILMLRSVQDQALSLQQATPLIGKLVVAQKQKEALDAQLEKMREGLQIKYESGYAPVSDKQ